MRDPSFACSDISEDFGGERDDGKDYRAKIF